ncbi:hypothetical protein PENTCL1PPCAC_19217 [Pristionchus entomophagus]|uniref:RING-type domain-containing protein n=1 Tax=Pristionchus entomophagus TaxID=358040 RepID=A0AAV5TS34_9BILA|nr:hypothetical protein PENTCL1PPCAC_19217 [Pristionchus entomophagus]
MTRIIDFLPFLMDDCDLAEKMLRAAEDVMNEKKTAMYLPALTHLLALSSKLLQKGVAIEAIDICNLINEGHFSQLQSAVVRIPIDCIDLHKVMTTCRQNGLYDGVIYVMNRALGDYLGPLEEMLDTVASFSGRGDLLSDHEVQQGAQLLLYLNCCLYGTAYPIGVLPEEQKRTVPVQVYRCITSVHGKEGVGRREEGAYPYLRLLLQFDALQFLHVVCTCADADLFKSEDNRLQRLTEIVGMLSLECKSATILSEYLKFVANLVATDRILTPTETVNQGIEALLRLPSLTQGEEQAVVEVMRYVTGIDVERVLRLSAKPLRVTICSHIYRLQRRFVELLKCYLTSPVNTDSFFDVSSRLLVSDLTREERRTTEEYLKERIEDLSSLSPSSTASLVVDHLGTYWADLRRRTNPDQRHGVRQKCGEMISEAFRLRRDRGDCFLTSDEEVDEWAFEVAFEWACQEGGKEDAELKSLLLYWLPLGSKTDCCLNAAAANGKRTASVVLLLEARGLLSRAFSLLLDRLNEAIAEGETERLLSSTDDILSLARSHPEQSREFGWLLTLFRRIVETTKIGEGKGEMHDRLLHTVERVLESGTEKAIDIVQSLLQYPAFREASYRDHSSLLNSMIDACEYEGRLLDSFLWIQATEGVDAFREITAFSSHRINSIVAPECVICGEGITRAAYLYSCGHMQHQECWSSGEKACPVCVEDLPSESSTTVIRGVVPHQRGALGYARDERRQKKRKNIFDMWDDEMHLGPKL